MNTEEIKEAVNNFLKTTDLDELQSCYALLRKTYDLKNIRECIEQLDIEITEQGLANVLFNQDILSPAMRSGLLKGALDLKFGEYVYLAAVSNFKEEDLFENEIRYFVLLMGRFFHTMVMQKWKDRVALLIANRTLVALLRIEKKPKIEDFHHAFLPVLKDPSYQPLFHNTILALLSYMPHIFQNENLHRELEHTVGSEMYNQIFTTWKIMQKKDADRTQEESLKTHPLFSPIPDLKDLVSEGQIEQLKNLKWSNLKNFFTEEERSFPKRDI